MTTSTRIRSAYVVEALWLICISIVERACPPNRALAFAELIAAKIVVVAPVIVFSVVDAVVFNKLTVELAVELAST